MDEVVKRAIAATESKKKTSVDWEFDKPWRQTYYVYSSEQAKWLPTAPSGSNNPASNISRINLYSWNIDFMLPHPDARMNAAVRHLESQVQKHDERTATIIFLQECVESDLKLLAADAWIQRTFAVTDVDPANWQSGHYGTVTLVDRRLPITNCFRVHYSQTRMERDAFFVDTRFGKEGGILRFCNTHLESLALEPPYRPPQMAMAAKYMRDPQVHGAVVAGDFNAIQNFDRTLHEDNGLKDAYLEQIGGSEDDVEAEHGHTWGQQAATNQRERFGTSRMDKVFFCGGVRCVQFERFGAGVELENDAERDDIVQLGFDKPWITDHLGVKAVFELYGGSRGLESSL